MNRHKTPIKKWFGVYPVEWVVYSLVFDETDREYIGVSRDFNKRLCKHAKDIQDKREAAYSKRFIRDKISHIFNLRPRILGHFGEDEEAARRFENRMIEKRQPAYNKGIDAIGNYPGRTRTMTKAALQASLKNLGKFTVGKPVVCIDTGERFEKVKDAAAAFGISEAHIIDCCKHKTYRAKGLQFEYEDEDLRNSFPPRAKPHNRKHGILCTTTGEVFNSITEAAKKYKISAGNICNHLKGNQDHVRSFRFRRLS